MEEKSHVTDRNHTGERSHVVGKSVKRVDAFEKVTGRAKYTDDLCDKNAYVAKVLALYDRPWIREVHRHV